MKYPKFKDQAKGLGGREWQRVAVPPKFFQSGEAQWCAELPIEGVVQGVGSPEAFGCMMLYAWICLDLLGFAGGMLGSP